ncbi:hypothetical protein LTR28_002702, partial [Elasticomyces elasticus]
TAPRTWTTAASCPSPTPCMRNGRTTQEGVCWVCPRSGWTVLLGKSFVGRERGLQVRRRRARTCVGGWSWRCS